MNTENLTITVVGGGSSAHTIIPLLSSSKYIVNVLTSKPHLWSKEVELQYQAFNGAVIKKFHGNLNKISADPKDVITEADVIFLCMPVSQYRNALHRIAPQLNKEKDVHIGAVYGQAGFNWMVNEIKRTFNLQNVITFSFGLIPWICRTLEYGKIGITYGVKPVNIAAVEPKSHFDDLNENIFKKVCLDWFGMGAFKQADNFLSLTFSVDNQIIHPARCYGLFVRYGGEWDKLEDVPFFYKDFDQLSADILIKLDADYSKIRERIKQKYPHKKFTYMLDYLALDRHTNETEEYSVLESFLLSRTLGAIRAPTVKTETGKWQIDTNHRFFTDDIHYGLCIAKWTAEQLALDVPAIDEIINWAQELRQETLIENGKLRLDSPDLNRKFKSGVPHFYGYQTIDEIVN
ncbi:MAG: NAD/NADP octopine/nopaline dehydrogenase family protein [Anaerolineaceae bacterium]|nr:NAD/NADP octopine/nopaline dehydrogenase family protein [Anaerolineaceae bacterium]